MNTSRTNPYIGPRPYETGETLYGRDRELELLTDLLIAERIVLLYSPSGAGKTSLINAGLLPRMENEGFVVLPPARVNSAPGDHSPANRYIYSVLSSLEKGLDEGQQATPEQLARMSLEDYLGHRRPAPQDEGKPPAPVLLIFDQFEEILTVEPSDKEGKQAFFKQIAEALYQPRVWALFAMREEFIAALDPYIKAVPSRLTNRFRLDLLEAGPARQAIQRPAAGQGVDFTDAAAEKLVNDLRTVKVVSPAGETSDELGLYVEPVQLQVVCYELWKRLPDDDNNITEDEIQESGDVDASLGAYYAHKMNEIAPQASQQRAVREWLEKEMLTRGNLRNQVLLDETLVDQVGIATLEGLENAHLIRRDTRRNRVWLEIAHDRLVAPIRKENADWFQVNLSLLQRQADLWQEQNRPDHLLLRDQALVEAEQWAAEGQTELNSVEKEFLEASLEIRRQEEATQQAKERELEMARKLADAEKERADVQARSVRRLRWLALILTVVLAVAVGLAILAFNAQRSADANAVEAQRLARLARRGALLAYATEALERAPQRSLLLAIESIRHTIAFGEQVTPGERQALYNAINATGGLPLAEHTQNVTMLALSPKRGWLITGSRDGTALVWDLAALPLPKVIYRLAHGLPGAGPEDLQSVFSGAISKDERWLATGCGDGSVWLWDLQATDPSVAPIVLKGHEGQVRVLDFSNDTRWLASGSWAKSEHLSLWDLSALKPGMANIPLTGHKERISKVLFSPDNRWLATASEDKTARLWDLSDPGQVVTGTILGEHTGKVATLAFDPDSRWLATGGDDLTVKLWEIKDTAPVSSTITLAGHIGAIGDLKFSPSGELLASASSDHTVRLWRFEDALTRNFPVVLRDHREPIRVIEFIGETLLVSAGDDRTARIWNLKGADPSANPLVLKGHDGLVRDLAVSPDGSWLVTASEDNTARLWVLDRPDPNTNPIVLEGHNGVIWDIEFSPDGRWLASGGEDQIVRFWNMDSANPAALPVMLSGADKAILDVAFSSNGRWFAAASADMTVRLMDLANQAANPVVLGGHTAGISAVTFSEDGRWVGTSSSDKTARVWRLETTGPAVQPLILSGHGESVNHIAFSPDGRWAATASSDKTARLWDLAEPDPGTRSITLAGHGNILRVAFSPDGRWLATSSKDKVILLWDLASPDPAANPRQLVGHDAEIWEIEFSPDGRWLASASIDDTAQLWDLRQLDGSLVSTKLRHDGHVSEVEFDPGNRWLATVGRDQNAILWDLSIPDPAANPVKLHKLPYPSLDVTFSPDGRWLAVSGSNGPIQLWRVDVDELVTLACNLSGRNLAKKDWEILFPGEPYRKTCEQWPEK